MSFYETIKMASGGRAFQSKLFHVVLNNYASKSGKCNSNSKLNERITLDSFETTT